MGERRFTEAELAGETWETVPDTLGTYAVSTLGRVRHLHPPRSGRPLSEGDILADWTDDRNYRHVALRVGREQATAMVHALMTAAFVGPAPSDEHVACFKDGDPTHLAPDNLAWLTPLERTELARERGASRVRPVRLRDGVAFYQCARCSEWKAADDFYELPQTYSRHGNPMSRCRRNSECRRCDNGRRSERRRVARANGGRSPSRLELIWPILFELDKLDVELGDPSAPTPAERIRKAREAAGISRQEVVRRTGIHPETMDTIERGENTPRPATLRKILAALRGSRTAAAGPCPRPYRFSP